MNPQDAGHVSGLACLVYQHLSSRTFCSVALRLVQNGLAYKPLSCYSVLYISSSEFVARNSFIQQRLEEAAFRAFFLWTYCRRCNGYHCILCNPSCWELLQRSLGCFQELQLGCIHHMFKRRHTTVTGRTENEATFILARSLIYTALAGNAT